MSIPQVDFPGTFLGHWSHCYQKQLLQSSLCHWWSLISSRSCRLHKHWLKGKKAGTSEVLAVLPGFPQQCQDRASFGWHSTVNDLVYLSILIVPKNLDNYNQAPNSCKNSVPALHQGLASCPHGVVVKYSPKGKLLQILEDNQGKLFKATSEVEEKDGRLWMGNVDAFHCSLQLD